MKTIKKQILKNIVHANMLILSLCLLVSCNEDVTIKQDFDYNIRIQKYRTDVKVGVPVNLVFFIDSEGNYSDTHYKVNYFLRKGTGQLRSDDNTPLIDNILYEIQSGTLRINYTPSEKGEHVIEIEFADNFNQKKEIIIKLSAD
ncbi:TraQ conjugal transfer family protein [Bacteroides sp. CG01]|uniref:TraQ conjugal transfer family protein n=1 Tax=Bacteroides sp. CG01 TaxID=3096000 RepID=UPI002AFF4802|nr:TraQ conjugal transfer family protein [Bacteroides sp. CG01]